MRRFLSVAVLVLVSSASLAATLPELFLNAKEQFKLGNYKESLAIVETLDAESAKPGLEAERQKILPGLLFYKGANLAALGRADEAQQTFEAFLVLQPATSLDPARYAPKVIAAFEAARKASAPAAPSEPASTGVIAAAYRAFKPSGNKPDEQLGEDWAAGPAKYLLTPAEREDYERLSDPLARSEYIANFWKSRDPRPETPENELREEFEKRVAFADVRFVQGETRGSLTDRGMVFILFGPPTYNGQRPLYTQQEAGGADAGQSRYSSAEVTMAQHPGGPSSSAQTAATAKTDTVTGTGASMGRSASNWVESWTYLRAELPKSVPYQELKVQFVTKDGYGKNVLQREPNVLIAIERVKKSVRESDSASKSHS